MKKKLLFICAFFMTTVTLAQNSKDVTALISSGNNVFIEIIDKKENIENEDKVFRNYLDDSSEWGRWVVVESKDEADFMCRLTLEKKGSGFSLSLGARVAAFIEIINKEGKVVWKSKTYTGQSNEFTGFNSLADAMRKIVRKAIKKDLYNEE